jgi:hypothetical protein
MPEDNVEQSGNGAFINIASLSIPELQKLRVSLTNDMKNITGNLGNIKLASNKYLKAKESILELETEKNRENEKKQQGKSDGKYL